MYIKLTPKRVKLAQIFLSPYVVIPIITALLVFILAGKINASSAYDWSWHQSEIGQTSSSYPACSIGSTQQNYLDFVLSKSATITTEWGNIETNGYGSMAISHYSGDSLEVFLEEDNANAYIFWYSTSQKVQFRSSSSYKKYTITFTNGSCDTSVTGPTLVTSTDLGTSVRNTDFLYGDLDLAYPVGYTSQNGSSPTFYSPYVPPIDYSANYTTTSEIRITDDSLTCSDQSMNETWYTYLQDATTAQTHYLSAPNLLNAQNGLQNAIINGSAWGVSTQRNTFGADQVVKVFWTENGNPTLNWTEDRLELVKDPSGDNISYITYMIKFAHDGSGGCTPEIIDYHHKTETTYEISNDNTIDPLINNVFLSGVTPTYPDGYTGLDIVDHFAAPRALNPAVEYSVEFLTIKARYLVTIGTSNNENILLNWTLQNKDQYGFWQEYDTQILGYLDQYTIDVPDLGEYKLFLTIDLNGETINEEGVFLNPTEVNIEVTGIDYGSTCSDGVCAYVSPYEDCSVYSYTDVVNGITCNLGNFFTKLKLFFTGLIVPNPVRIKQTVIAQQGKLETELGGIGYPIYYFIDLASDISSNADTEQCAIPTSTQFGVIPFGVCDTAFGSSEPFVFAVIRGMFALSLILLLYRIYNNIIDERSGQA